jgi:hypothetical protein
MSKSDKEDNEGQALAILSPDYYQLSRYTDELLNILAWAYQFDDKPHRLFSAISRAARVAGDANIIPEDEAEEIIRLMDLAYERVGQFPSLWRE